MTHDNAALLEKLYAAIAKKDMQAVLAHFSDAATFQVPGKSPLAGKYTKANYAQDFAAKLTELSDGTFAIEVHDILANDRHATVLVTESLMRRGEKVQIRAAHVWRFEHGKPVAWYEYPRDLYQYDAVWS